MEGKERKWILGEDLTRHDNLLDPITFDDVMLALRTSYPVIDEKSFNEALNSIMQMRMNDFRELLRKNKWLMIEFVKREREGWE